MERVTITSRYNHTRYHTFSLSLAWFEGYLQRVTTRYRQIFKKLMVTRERKSTVTRVVTR